MSTGTSTVDYDVLVVGAGLSGIGAGYRLQTECPGKTYAILEARESIGGTWDLFRYPGIRSDSDMFTLSFPFRPWTDENSIADGPSILSYIKETAAEYGIDEHIQFRTKVTGANWNSDTSTWTVSVEDRSGERKVKRTITCSFLYACSGYYDYNQGHEPEFPGLDDFAGLVVKPQFWPENLDYSGKKVVIIGSGATAITLAPSMAEDAAHVTMLQRSPTWVGVVPKQDKVANRLRSVLPAGMAHQIIRNKNAAFSIGVYELSQRQPKLMKQIFRSMAMRGIKDEALVAEHFTPSYNPWDQRLCAIPNGDLFKKIRNGRVDVVTDHIDTFLPEGIRLKSGKVLEADIVVPATGLKIQLFGGVQPTVDGEAVNLHENFVWQGCMLTGLPNFALCVGYTNASWTLRGDLTSRLVCKVINEMDKVGAATVIPVPDGPLEGRPLLDLSSGYIQRALGELPQQGHRGAWRVRQNYFIDAATTLRRDLHKTLKFSPAKVPAKASA
ncbi:flavin-containing monooxygenase [Nocardioides marmorisolisilvae]|uniref:NAD(P)/FAD-dependent oxidoreductase n=1 Tax=Nocardioides marmorisolisilvae TaxID=1542737 RepID=A0A3N0DIE4_9ACTN|nr:NAD(P)/FAD-dependent oxidoreductase [Nocardioides marmorisolisilvae]RNL75435.1 NAD(P)/FAD-dependent oxidoreductase [Nocardioides marmorisolisilvae]